MQTAGTILVGFMFFGVALQHTGGADFFHQLSNAIFGKYPGGSAKVSVASSAAMGMMSGSAVSSVLTTGPVRLSPHLQDSDPSRGRTESLPRRTQPPQRPKKPNESAHPTRREAA